MAHNLFENLPRERLPQELFNTILTGPGIRIERIVSTGQASPVGFWYDQSGEEWVVLLTGAATLRFEDEAEVRQMQPGDWVHIAAHRRHRVEWTNPDTPSTWLAVHFGDVGDGPARNDYGVDQ
ncbi:MAG TPA: cupin domain-containing protein [Anaerolineae bacterium]|nr:cupin domain-containing protein [Anaerolineae bacterium]